MKIVNEIIEMLSTEGSSLNDALLKTKVLLHRLGEKESIEWVNLELQGYRDENELPDYRKIAMRVRGNISNGAYRYTDQALATGHLEDHLRSSLGSAKLTQSIAVLEAYAKKDEDLTISVAPEYYPLLSRSFENGYIVEQAWGKPSAGCMVQAVTEVKSRLLGFVLELSEKLPEELDGNDLKNASTNANVSELFNNTVIGDNATFVIGDNNVQNIQNNIQVNDFESLENELLRNNVPAEDIVELRLAIDADEGADEHTNKSFGSNVNAWIGKMISKASSSSWAVGVGAAGNLLATAIKTFYGF